MYFPYCVLLCLLSFFHPLKLSGWFFLNHIGGCAHTRPRGQVGEGYYAHLTTKVVTIGTYLFFIEFSLYRTFSHQIIPFSQTSRCSSTCLFQID
jgi:hypothetical protein